MNSRSLMPRLALWTVVFAFTLGTRAAEPVAEPAKQTFPAHWGPPPRIQTRDYRPLPGGYGFGSSTLASWIQRNLDQDRDGAGRGMVFPEAAWQESTPEAQGLDSAKLQTAIQHLKNNTGRDGVRELVIVRNGRLVWKGDHVDHVHGVWSCTKTFTGTTLGLLVQDGVCTLETRAAEFMPELRAHYPEIKLRHLATMTSGYRAEGDEPQGSYRHGPSRTPFQPSAQPLFIPPGSQYAYWDSAMNVLGLVLTRIAKEPMEALFQRRVAGAIGLDPANWDWGDYATDQGVVVNGGAGNGGKHVLISARELARLGHLFLNNGQWNGRQVIAPDWVHQATGVQVPAALPWAQPESEIDGRGCYGLNWWVNGLRADGRRQWPGAPLGTFAASGHNNNRLVVIPEWRMVIVRLGLDQADRKLTDEVLGEFLKKVGEALVEGGVGKVGGGEGGSPVAQASTDGTTGRPASRPADGTGAIAITGEIKQWHNVTLTLDGPFAREEDQKPNPFLDYRFTVTFIHHEGSLKHTVPGYFAADGHAANTSAESGTKWRAHLSPDKPGRWHYSVSFVKGNQIAIRTDAGERVKPFDGKTGTFVVARTDKKGRDFRAKGRLHYVGQHYLRFAGSGEYFLKAGADAPETLLACADFDGTRAHKAAGTPARPGEAAPAGLKSWQPHARDWRAGDPSWKSGQGKGLIGALNYLASAGCNVFSFLPYNAGGDGDNVWPFVQRADKLHYDCSKLDQWGIAFEHATRLGLFLHFKLQETEMDDQRSGGERRPAQVPEALDGGALGPERKLYLRELIARFGHALALNWNLGEENTQTAEEQRAMAQFIHDTDPYRHLIVVHTYPNEQDRVYAPLLREASAFTGASLQNHWDEAHARTLKWVRASEEAGRPWVVCNDEQGDAGLGVPPDPGYAGFSGEAREKNGRTYTLHDIRKRTLWGALLAGGAGVEYYFGYTLPQNDLACEDWRSRQRSWEYCRVALEFFREQRIPFWAMRNADELVGNARHDNSRYCFATPGRLYLVYLPDGGEGQLDLRDAPGRFKVRWFNPRSGGPLRQGTVRRVRGGAVVSLGQPPADPAEDWLIVVK